MTFSRLAKICITGVFVMAAPAAMSQIDAEGDSDIFVKAEKATYSGSTTLLEGSVDVKQGDTRILSDKMHIYRADNKGDNSSANLVLGEVVRIEAEGSFEYITPANRVTGDKGVYKRDTGIFIVTGDVTYIQASGSQVRGKRLIYDVESRSAKFDNPCVGDDCSGRVRFNINQ